MSCNCAQKVPQALQPFLLDQRNSRKLKIPKVSLKNSQTTQSKQSMPKRTINSQFSVSLPNLSSNPETCSLENISNSMDQYNLRQRSIDKSNDKLKFNTRNNVKLTQTAISADRYRLSNTAVAAIGTAVLIDYNVIDSDNSRFVIDRNKVQRNRNIVRNSAIEMQVSQSSPVYALYFDGRKDFTKSMITVKL